MKAVRVVLMPLMCLWGGMAGAQVPASAPTSQGAAAEGVPSSAGSRRTTELLEPTMNSLPATLSTLRVDKWKASNQVKDAAMNNITSIKRDLQDTLPPLLKAADSAPGNVSALLAVMQNVTALYDVVLRVWDAAEIAAPQAQGADVAQAMSGLLVARRGLEEMMRNAVSAQEKRAKDLQASLDARPAVAAAPPPCPPAPSTKPAKKKAANKPAVK